MGIERGAYRHFKGSLYWVLGEARHSETEEPLVIYRALYGEGGVWARPLAMFLESVDARAYPQHAGRLRFEKISDGDAAVESVRGAHPEWFAL